MCSPSRRAFFWESLVRLRYLGEKYVPLCCEYGGIIEKAIIENKYWFDNLFGSIVPWNNSFVVTGKFVWVSCSGIP